MRYRGVIFDLDGVLCSTDRYHYLAWKQLADRLSISFDETVNNRLRGVSRMASLEIILEKSPVAYSAQEKEALAAEKNETYRKLLGGMSRADLAGGALETLRTLRGRSVLLAVGSSSRNAPFILEKIGLDGFFDAVVDGNAIMRSKPDPQVFVLAAQRLSLPPAACLVVEDAHAGVEAAVNGGFDCAAMGDAKDDPRARYRLERLEDLTAI